MDKIYILFLKPNRWNKSTILFSKWQKHFLYLLELLKM